MGADSGTFWLVDIASGKAEPVGYEYPQIRPAEVAATRTYRYRADAPILLIHGQDDTVVESLQSRRMADALRAEGRPVELVMMKGEDHHLSREVTRVEMLQKSVEFVLKHNPPDAAGP